MAAVHTHAHHQGARPGLGRKAIKQFNERLRRDQRDMERELRERAARVCYPTRDPDHLPKID